MLAHIGISKFKRAISELLDLIYEVCTEYLQIIFNINVPKYKYFRFDLVHQRPLELNMFIINC